MDQNMKLSLSNTVVQTNGHLVSDMDGEKVMMSVNTGKYYNLGTVGGRIWELIASPVQVQHLIEQLMEEYEIDVDTCRTQVLEFLQMLLKEDLIQSAHSVHS
ncbi:lasso peptide biosynthesis PqqD family chaperone [Xylanibacillus composti]|uniref:Lasso peptide biosynthesis PqqD family chaperone n=1 Tax=Xylanibacillus composti TaxID=1572762 RepID=A0A8J4H2I8_9BACL|nr:lasso peptide biosynthesis PqqD family chaperone [Xylanibacillus composti]MDT9724519.1 lasso peptide biosynthesis PqqD family chaperone [Xylanibacillus composti]GIQ69782.1 hypothetical protein XYCOK13_26060 [Xylanibacillus composti]